MGTACTGGYKGVRAVRPESVAGGGGDPLSSYTLYFYSINSLTMGARCSSVVRAFAYGAIGRRIDPS